MTSNCVTRNMDLDKVAYIIYIPFAVWANDK